jgi:hypothetical protein
MRIVGYVLGGIIILVGSFLITSWILSTNDPQNWKFTDDASLATAAAAAGYQSSADIIGYVDGVTRIDAGKFTINGWAADISGDGAPIALTVFANGRGIASFRTDGPRPDVTAAIKTNPKANAGAAKSTQYISTLSCRSGDKLVVIATTASKRYGLLVPHPYTCP